MVSYLWFHEEWHTEINSISTHNIINVQNGLSPSQSQVEDATDVVLLEHFPQSSLVLRGEFDKFDSDLVLRGPLKEVFHRPLGGVELVTKRRKVVDDVG